MPRIPKTGRHAASFFVYVIESPSPGDLFEERSERGLLKEALRLSGVPAVMRMVIDRRSLERALKDDIREVFLRRNAKLQEKGKPFEVPIVHISAHGNESGIRLSDGSDVSWTDLGDLLRPFSKLIKGKLILSLSSCQGLAAKVLAREVASCPFRAIVGHDGKPNWSDAAVGFTVFYHLLKKGVTAVAAEEAVRAATADGDLSFNVLTAERARSLVEDEDRMDRIIEEVLAELDP